MRIQRRLAELGLELPPLMQLPPRLTLPFPRVRLWRARASISGHGPLLPDGTLSPVTGKVGRDVTEEQAYDAARLTALAILASLQRALGDLDRVTGPLRHRGGRAPVQPPGGNRSRGSGRLKAKSIIPNGPRRLGGSMTHLVRLADADDAAVIGRLLHDFNREFDEPAPEPAVLAERL